MSGKIHHLKTWPTYFAAAVAGDKPFEVRKNDRDYQWNDILTLLEYDPGAEQYTGKQALFAVTYILYGPSFGIEDGYCVMGIRPLNEVKTR